MPRNATWMRAQPYEHNTRFKFYSPNISNFSTPLKSKQKRFSCARNFTKKIQMRFFANFLLLGAIATDVKELFKSELKRTTEALQDIPALTKIIHGEKTIL